MGTKKTLIADVLHYPITLTQLEKVILQNPIFNRLHGVKQNSTAYLTFPSMNHVRFSHSLGTMHLAGIMCLKGLHNAQEQVAERFLSEIGCVVDSIFRKSKSEIEHHLSDISDDLPVPTSILPRELLQAFPEYAQWSLAPYFANERSLSAYICIQALRIAALSHDLGHPPYSHVTEYAIKDLAEIYLSSQPTTKLNSRQKAFSTIARSLVKSPPHETLTRELFKNQLLNVELQTAPEHRVVSHIFVFVTMQLAQLILSEDAPSDGIDSKEATAIFALHQLISSDFDADRLDYVYRDTLMSGIRFEAVRSGRLIELIRLEMLEGDTKSAGLRFLPDIRAIRSLEDFFNARFELYQSVIYHHHVIKTDAILYRCVIALAEEWLQDSSGEAARPGDEKILSSDPQSIHWLWHIFALQENTRWSPRTRNAIYLQWDDGWLQSLLRAKYIKLREAKRDQLPIRQQVLFMQLEELLSGKRNYVSLIKRFSDYCDFNEELWEALRERRASLSQGGLQGIASEETKAPTASSEIRTWLLTGLDEPGPTTSLRERDILAHVKKLGYLIEDDLAGPSCTAFLNGGHAVAKDLIFSCKSMKAGFNGDFPIATDTQGKTVRIADYSRVAKSLLSSSSSFPSIFLFVLPEHELTRSMVFKELAKHFADNLIKSLT